METGRKKPKVKPPTQISFMMDNNSIIEQTYSKKDGVRFVIWDGEKVNYDTKLKIKDITYVPIFGDDVTKGLVALPDCAEEYGDEEKLVGEIKDFLKEWLGISESYYTIATYYILTTWVYDKFDTINYLRALGDSGVGKSRFLDTIGALCYKFTLVSGAVTPAPVFRLLEKWKGTLGIEEGDLKESDATNEIIKILNCGFEKGKPVVRCDKNDPSKIDTFEVFGPKVIVTRKEFYDQATEARCLTEIMAQDGSKPDTKTEGFYNKRNELRNKLLMFRFKNYHTVNVEKALEIDLRNLEPRLRQASRGFLALVWDKPKLLEEFKVFLKEYNDNLIEARSGSWEGSVVNAIAELVVEGDENITCKAIADRIDIEKLNFRKVGGILRRLKLELKPKLIDSKTKKVVFLDEKPLSVLFDRYIPDDTLREKAKNLGNISVITTLSSGNTRNNQKTLPKLPTILDSTKIKKEGLNDPPSPSPEVGNVGNSVIISPKDVKDTLFSQLAMQPEIEVQQFLSIYPEKFHAAIDIMLDNLKRDGEIYESKPGFVKML